MACADFPWFLGVRDTPKKPIGTFGHIDPTAHQPVVPPFGLEETFKVLLGNLINIFHLTRSTSKTPRRLTFTKKKLYKEIGWVFVGGFCKLKKPGVLVVVFAMTTRT